jgi:hypothetical protein
MEETAIVPYEPKEEELTSWDEPEAEIIEPDWVDMETGEPSEPDWADMQIEKAMRSSTEAMLDSTRSDDTLESVLAVLGGALLGGTGGWLLAKVLNKNEEEWIKYGFYSGALYLAVKEWSK